MWRDIPVGPAPTGGHAYPGAKGGAEMRRSPRNGKWYTKQSFAAHFGERGAAEWARAERRPAAGARGVKPPPKGVPTQRSLFACGGAKRLTEQELAEQLPFQSVRLSPLPGWGRFRPVALAGLPP